MPVETEALVPYFSCPSCSRRHTWKQSIAGKRGKCACGTTLDVPSFPPLIPAVPPPAPSRTSGTAARKIGDDAPAGATSLTAKSVMAGIPRRKGLSSDPVESAPALPPVVRDFVLPIVLLVLGVWATVAEAMHGANGQTVPFASAIVPMALNGIVGLGLGVGAVVLGSAMAGIALEGPMWQNILKLCGVALLPLPLGALAGRSVGGINGDIVSSLVSIALYFAGFWAVFKMAWSDRTVCVMLIWIIRSGAAYMIFRIVGAAHNYSI